MGALDGRVAVVTGGGDGLGRAEALLLAAEGAKVVVNDLKKATEAVGEIVAAGGHAIAVEGGVSDPGMGRAMVDAAVQNFGDLHIIVNNAGFVRDAMLVNMTDEQFDSILDVHLRGVFTLTRAAAGYWRDRAKAGQTADRSIINTTSGAGLHGNPGQFNYSAAKAGSAMMVVTAAAELKRYGVRANAIAPVAGTAPVLATPGLGEACRLLQAGMLATYVTDWLGVETIRRFKVRFANQVWPGDELTCAATITAISDDPEGRRVTVDLLCTRQDGSAALAGDAEFVLP